ncbi:SbcC-like subunit of palindrome specific endonucl ease [Vibrio phage D479]
MIKFIDIEYQNIMSVGNNPVYLTLNTDHKSLVTGTNGAGKSTFIEALTFGLYGKPFRNIKKPQLVNTVNKKKLLVTLKFQDRKHTYTIVRGIKPNKFEIYRDGDLIPQEAAVADYQEMLEKQILKMSLSTFKQIAVLGSAGYTPFMLLTAGKRREIIEDLLDIGIFSNMADLNKLQLRKLNDSIKEQQADIDARMNEIRIHIEYQKENQAAVGEDMAKLESRLAEYQAARETLAAEIIKYTDESSRALSELTEYDEEVSARMAELAKKHDAAVEKMDKLHRDMLAAFDDASKKAVNNIQSQHDEIIAKFDSEVERSVKDLESSQTSRREEYESHFDNEMPPRVSVDVIAEQKAQVATNKTELDSLAKNKSFYDTTVDCPTCRQAIPEKFAQEFIDLANRQIKELKTATVALVNEIKLAMAKNTEHQEYLDQGKRDVVQMNSEMTAERNEMMKRQTAERLELTGKTGAEMASLTNEQNTNRRQISDEASAERRELTDRNDKERKELQAETSSKRAVLSDTRHNASSQLQTAKTSQNANDTQLRQVEGDIAALKKRSESEDRTDLIKKLSSELKTVKMTNEHDVQTKHARDIVNTLLKDNGVKTMIIRQYIPLINKFINDYLKIMGANYNFILDEEFNETIKSRGRDDFSYTSFSQGERGRIDLALLFAFRDLVAARTGAMSSILVLDEVFDSATDTDGVDAINSILDNLPDNVMVISHNEKNQEKEFDRHLRFKKVGSFTRLEN